MPPIFGGSFVQIELEHFQEDIVGDVDRNQA